MMGGLAPLHFQRSAGVGLDDDVERGGRFPEIGDGVFEGGCRARGQPAAEGEEGGALVRRAGIGGQRSEQLGLAVLVAPYEDALVADGKQGFRALQRRVEVGDLDVLIEILGVRLAQIPAKEGRRGAEQRDVVLLDQLGILPARMRKRV